MRAILYFVKSDVSESLTVALSNERFWAKERRAKEPRAKKGTPNPDNTAVEKN